MLIGTSIGGIRVERVGRSEYWTAKHPKLTGKYLWNDLLNKLRSIGVEIPEIVVCSVCGKEEILGWMNNDDLRTHKMCFKCDFWRGHAERADSGQSVRVDGRHYFYHPDVPKDSPQFRGFGGRKFVIRFFDGREVTTHNLWHQGDIPDHWKDKLPNNAEFINGESDTT